MPRLQRLIQPEYDPLQIEAAAELVRRRKARSETLAFTEFVDPKYESGECHQIIAAALDDVLNDRCHRLIIEAPPQHGKSELATRKFPALYLGKRPDRKIMTGSYEADLASGFGRDVRNLVASERFRLLFPGTSLSQDSTAKDRWNTAQGGSYLSGGIGSSGGGGTGFTGRGANLLIIDDPIKDRSTAESEATRRHIWNWYISTAYTRLGENPSIVVISTRWHEDDLTGRLIREQENGGDKWRVVTLSTIGEHGEVKSVWPKRFPVDRLTQIMMNQGGPNSRDWTSLYGQRPTPQKGALFHTEQIGVMQAAPAGGTSVRAWDLAATREGGTRDPSWTCGVRMKRTESDRYVVEHVVRLRGAPDEVEAAIVKTAEQDGPIVKIGLPQDPGQAGKAQVQYLTGQLAGYRVESSPETGDKVTRAEPMIAQCNVGNVSLVAGAWNRPYLDELAVFPNARHEDQVDASSRAFNMLSPNKGARLWARLGAMA